MDSRRLLEQAFALHGQGRLAEAERLYGEVLRVSPGDENALHLTGVIAMQRGDLARALELMDRALAANPGIAPAHYNRATVMRDMGRPAQAVAGFDRAIALKPDYAEAFNGRGAALHDLHRLAQAADSFTRAIQSNPANADAWSNRAKVLLDFGRPGEAVADCDRALALAPDLAPAIFNKSLGLLTQGDYAQGFRLYEARRRIEPSLYVRAADRPAWTGVEDIAGKTLFLFWEQGFGDTLQFCRYISRVRALGARVIVSAQEPLRRLLAQSWPDIEIIAENDAPAAFDYSAPLMSLPLAFGETRQTLRAPGRYLAPDPQAADKWRARLDRLPGRKVGLVWAGGAKSGNLVAKAADQRRSLPLAAFAPLRAAPGVTFVSLQKGPAGAQAAGGPLAMFDPTAELADFADTAALVAGLDLVITVDTAVAHLAGALAKPVWVLNRFDTCWRWMLGRDDSPWYPTLRLFRQSAPGDWAPVIERAASALIAAAGQTRR